ncbi:MAG: type II toxin-antitoxin system RelE/ParE family toxin [Acidobacteriota bacterium]
MNPDRILRWHDRAVQDLEEAHSYLLEHSPPAARRFAKTVLDAAERLRFYPELGPIAWDLRPQGRYRSWVCGHHRLIYRVDSEVVWLLRVWDSRRNPNALTAPDA